MGENIDTVQAIRDLYRQSYRNAAKVIIAGGRDFADYEFMEETLHNLFWVEDFCGDKEIKIISGMADGADTLAIRFADEHQLTKILFPANWKLHHRMAGFLRNEDMIQWATHLVAFWDGKSQGTKHIIELAQDKGILNERKEVDLTDITLLFHSLWNKTECVNTVYHIIATGFFHDPQKKLATFMKTLDAQSSKNGKEVSANSFNYQIYQYFYVKLLTAKNQPSDPDTYFFLKDYEKLSFSKHSGRVVHHPE